MIEYIKQHWLGALTLRQAFWVNFVFGLILICTIEFLIHHNVEIKTSYIIPVFIAYFIVFHLGAFTWQIVGTLRCCEKNIQHYISTGWSRVAQLFVLVAITGVMIWAITLTQTIQRLKLIEHERTSSQLNLSNYSLKIIQEHSLEISGELSPGITREVKILLLDQSSIINVILNSHGGNIFEARGLAKLINDNEYSTHVDNDCLSACAIVFISGNVRTITKNAKLGFHQYRLDTLKLVSTNLDIQKEEKRDKTYYDAQGINPNFTNKAFSTPHQTMWIPTHAELINSNVVHRVITNP